MPRKPSSTPPKNTRRPAPRLKTPDGLTPKQQQFVAEYLVDRNATQAAIRSGYSEATAKSIGSENLTKPAILAAVCEGLQKLLAAPLSEAERVIQEAARLAFSDIRKVFDEHGNLINIKELGDDIAPAVSSVEVTERRGGKDTGVETTRKLRLWDKTAGLNILAKYHKLLTEKVELSGSVKVAQAEIAESSDEELLARLEALAKRAAALATG